MKQKTHTSIPLKVRSLFLKHQGYLRASEAFGYGIHPRDLYAWREQGEIKLVSRGLFRLSSMPTLEFPELFVIGVKVSKGVLCLLSALEFHQLIDKASSEFSIALVKGSEKPKIQGIPIKFYLFSDPTFSEGIETHQKDGIDIRIYCREKTIADCFKFRNKIGLAHCLEALQAWWNLKNKNQELLSYYSRLCRVQKIIQPYLELLTAQKKIKVH